jgi:transposase-like protein
MQTPELLSDPAYHDEDAARAYIESVRWPEQVFCPLCGGLEKIAKLGGDSMGPGWWYCGDCQGKFTVRVGTIFERSHIPLHKWLLAFRLMASSKKGVSAHQLHRTLGVTYKSAWFLGHRIREAMKETDPAPLGGAGKTIEADETYYGRQENKSGEGTWRFHNDLGWVKHFGGVSKTKIPVVTLVERGGKARSVKVENVTAATLRATVLGNADTASTLMTDELGSYTRLGRRFARHATVNHGNSEYVRKLGDGTKASTNTVEGYFSIFKRGMVGVYQHCNERHLPRYLAEFDFRYSNRVKLGVDDTERTRRAIRGAEGKRLTYRRTGSQEGEAGAA